jgi:hypothetical protein
VPDGGTHNEIPGVSNGTTAETTEEAPEGDPINTTYTDKDGSAMVDYGDSHPANPETMTRKSSRIPTTAEVRTKTKRRQKYWTVKYTTPNL